MTLPEVSVAVQCVHRDVERLDGGLEAVAGGLHERGVGGRQRAVGEEARGHASELVEDRVVGEGRREILERPVTDAQRAARGQRVDRVPVGTARSQNVSARPSRSCGPGSTALLGATTGAPRRAR
jgi:hypothetical protein